MKDVPPKRTDTNLTIQRMIKKPRRKEAADQTAVTTNASTNPTEIWPVIRRVLTILRTMPREIIAVWCPFKRR